MEQHMLAFGDIRRFRDATFLGEELFVDAPQKL
jgi:hypothetical protein